MGRESTIPFDIDKFVRRNVRELRPYASARDDFYAEDSNLVFLDANENPFDSGVNRYPDPHQRKLKAILAKRRKVDIGQILLGNGSDEVLDLIFRAFCEPGRDNIITLPPTYGMYKVLAGVNNIENREVILTQELQPDIEAIRRVVDKRTKALFLTSPNNPTGTSIDAAILETLLRTLNCLVVLDEAYIDFSSYSSWLNRLDEFPNLIVTQTFSKAYGMAGIRLGIGYASKEIIAILEKIKPPYNVNDLTLESAMKKLKDEDSLNREVSLILKERDNVKEEMKEIKWIQEIYPSDANFLLVRVDDADRRYRQLIDSGIIVRNRSNQPRCAQALRFTVGTPEENKKLITVLNSL